MKHYFLILLLVLPASLASQETQPISGKITDGSQPLADVAISLEGTNRGTFTNEEGRYEIQATEGQVLVYRLPG